MPRLRVEGSSRTCKPLDATRANPQRLRLVRIPHPECEQIAAPLQEADPACRRRYLMQNSNSLRSLRPSKDLLNVKERDGLGGPTRYRRSVQPEIERSIGDRPCHHRKDGTLDQGLIRCGHAATRPNGRCSEHECQERNRSESHQSCMVGRCAIPGPVPAKRGRWEFDARNCRLAGPCRT